MLVRQALFHSEPRDIRALNMRTEEVGAIRAASVERIDPRAQAYSAKYPRVHGPFRDAVAPRAPWQDNKKVPNDPARDEARRSSDGLAEGAAW